jgi:5-formyltetrahydrofolate cyclo-ligase
LEKTVPLAERKQRLREQALIKRDAQPDKDELSGAICRRATTLAEYVRAGTVLWYLDVRTEVRTRYDLPDALAGGKRIVVPYCVGSELALFHLESMDELSVGRYRIMEPKPELRRVAVKKVEPADLDLILAPGVAFDLRGARLGHGFAYYDKLMRRARPDAAIVGLAFECQLFPEVPTEAHDIFVNRVVTERTVYDCSGRRGV